MKQPVFLKSFEYSIPALGKDFNHSGNMYRDYLEEHLPLVKVNIDFENKYLFIEGNGDLAKTLTKKVGLTRFDFDNKRIKVNANIYCGLSINLTASNEEGLVYILEGVIDDGEYKYPCTGLLIIDNRATSQQSGDDEWDLRVHLFDSANEEKEINIDLIISSMSQNAELN
jgi:hypothetical protein